MLNPKSVLVSTTSSLDGMKIKKYLKPVSAHIVAGTNLFSDFFASLSDVFGGRSQTYQKQLTSLYDEAIERIKFAAYEIGANCVIGLSIDMDEISGKGKSMFMITAIGTAVILEKEIAENNLLLKPDKKIENIENVSVERINNLKNKKAIIEKANSGTLTLDDNSWNFLTSNQVNEVFPFLIKQFSQVVASDEFHSGISENFFKLFVTYIDALPDDIKVYLVYNAVNEEQNEQVALQIAKIIKELNLFDFTRTIELLQAEDFSTKKIGLQITTYDKPFYNHQDKLDIQIIRNIIKDVFVERGTRTTKKQLLSSKEKEVWVCECGKSNEIGYYCNNCNKDIYGFKMNEIKPSTVDNLLKQKIELISDYLN